MGEVTPAEMVTIANSFLLNAPPGEFSEVVTDVQGLLPDVSMLNDTAPATFSAWNTAQMLQVNSPSGGHQVLITKYGEVANGEYLDPRGKCVIQFDHIKQEVSGHRPLAGELVDAVEGYRSAFDKEAAGYVGDHYMNGGCTVYGSQEGGGTNITVCISSSKFNPNNFWNGRWRSVWTCKFSGSGAITLSGQIQVNVHYYEDGNVQLNTSTNKTGKANGGNPQAAAAAAIGAIKKIEAEFQAALDHSYNTMGDTTFKALRRVLPITRQRIDWNKIRNYRIGNEAASTK
jgi:capping protein alpha